MKRTSPRKGEKKTSRPTPEKAKPKRQKGVAKADSAEVCAYCSQDLAGEARALFVEEEVGRVFCSEQCIAQYFTPDIERLEKEYFRRLSDNDLSASERESLAHLRWITLQEPDEVWREKTLAGDNRYTLISEFQPGVKRVWSVCICLFLRGEPSFLYLAFVTRNAAMVNAYRKGEPVEWTRPKRQTQTGEAEDGVVDEGEMSGLPTGDESGPSDRLADSWTEDETYLAQLRQGRSADDIPPEEFEPYHSNMQETLESPNEVWSLKLGANSPKLYHFIRHYQEFQGEPEPFAYVVLARETDDEEQIEVLDAFPTRDESLLDQLRRGEQEVGETVEVPLSSSRTVH